MSDSIRMFFAKVRADSRLSVNGIGVRELMPASYIDRPHGTGDYLLMLFNQPQVIGVSDTRLEYPAQRCMLWKKGAGHYYGCDEEWWQHSWIHCDGSLVERFAKESKIPFGQPFDVAHIADIFDDYLTRIYDEITSHEDYDQIIVESIFRSMFREIGRSNSQTSEYPEKYLQIKAMLDEFPHKHYALDGLADKINVSASHFCSEFKRFFGESPMSYVIARRMESASWLLRNMNLRVGEVARKVGYEDAYYFSKLFKKHFGKSPRAWRDDLSRKRSVNN